MKVENQTCSNVPNNEVSKVELPEIVVDNSPPQVIAPFFLKSKQTSLRKETNVSNNVKESPRSFDPTRVPLKLGRRRLNRWHNDHHTRNTFTTNLEDIMEHMTLDVSWKSNFEAMLTDGNQDVREVFLQGNVFESDVKISNFHRNDHWNEAEERFMSIEKRGRNLLIKSFKNFSPFIQAIENLLQYFFEWNELPSTMEISRSLHRLLVSPLSSSLDSNNEIVLCIPLKQSSFHRLLIHSVCQFYSLSSQSIDTAGIGRIMHIKKQKHYRNYFDISLSEFIYETRTSMNDPFVPLTRKAKSSSCDSDSDGYQLIDLHEF